MEGEKSDEVRQAGVTPVSSSSQTMAGASTDQPIYGELDDGSLNMAADFPDVSLADEEDTSEYDDDNDSASADSYTLHDDDVTSDQASESTGVAAIAQLAGPMAQLGAPDRPEDSSVTVNPAVDHSVSQSGGVTVAEPMEVTPSSPGGGAPPLYTTAASLASSSASVSASISASVTSVAASSSTSVVPV